ncbi:PHP domain protein [Candidatus Desulfosporosinus infrequens]|uniref:protein-tyrosine-phosphatase n=1 Tax=Candidatus Desulfosporosinus infrequens TaxID=2043169 RepID=A0A2U3LD82_9FIRM|nr:PHP domain protein [Candidatus Desulfosporosinus infrequens]
MIDIHSHILPGLDDGATKMEETLVMVRQLHEAGFNTLLATPHVMEGKDFLHPEDILTVTEQVRERAAEAGIPVEVLPGSENYIFPDMAKWVDAGKLLTLGNKGKYLLIELPMLEIPQYTDQVFFELQVKGLIPVLAHPERNKGLSDDPERLLEWAKRGIVFQLDLRSLSGYYGPQAKRLAKLMLNSKLVRLLGTDAHRVNRSDLSYSEALQGVKDIIGEAGFQEVTLKNPQLVLEGKLLPSDVRDYILNEPVKMRKRGFWNMFRR